MYLILLAVFVNILTLNSFLQTIVPIAKPQPSRATVLMQLSQLKDMHRQPRPMGNRVTELMDSPLMSVTHRLRQPHHMGKLHMQLLMGSLQQVIPPRLPPQLIVSLSRATVQRPMILPPPQLLRPRLLMQHSLLMAPSLPTQRMGSSQQHLHLQDPRIAASQRRPANLSRVPQATASPA